MQLGQHQMGHLWGKPFLSSAPARLLLPSKALPSPLASWTDTSSLGQQIPPDMPRMPTQIQNTTLLSPMQGSIAQGVESLATHYTANTIGNITESARSTS
jgi:hypothetical protein